MVKRSAVRVCMVVSNPMTNDSRVEREAQSLAAAGYKLTIYATGGERLRRFERRAGYTIRRLSVANYDLIHVRFWRLFGFFRALKALRNEKAEIYHAHDADALLICFLAARATRAKLVYDFHEYWDGRAYKAGNVIGDLWLKYVKKTEYSLVQRLITPYCNALVTVNQSLAQEFSEHYKPSTEPVVLYNVPRVNKSRIRSVSLRRKAGLGTHAKILLYLGGFIEGRGLDRLVESLNYLPDFFVLVLMGFGPLKSRLEKNSLLPEYSRRLFVLDPVAPEEIPIWASGADVGVTAIQNTSQNNFYSLPNKVFEYIISGLPVACSRFPELERLVVGEGLGVVFNPEDARDIARAIGEICSSDSRYQQFKRTVMRVGRYKYNWEIEEKKLLSLYSRL